nr:hypothetical protein [uncultured Ruegeria sp.]
MSQSEDHQPSAGRSSLFLERQGYRRRRLMDAARLLPVLGGALVAIPLLWPSVDSAGAGVPLSSAIYYIFACWGLLILASVGFGYAARRLSRRDETEADTDQWQR